VKKYFVLSALLMSGAAALSAQNPAPIVRSMSMAELEICANRAVDLSGEATGIKELDQALQRRGLAVRAESTAIDALRARVNVRDPKAVAAFNARLKRNQAAIENYRREAEARNAIARKSDVHRAEFGVQCTGRPYDLADLDKLPAPARAALAAISNPTSVPVVETGTAPLAGSTSGAFGMGASRRTATSENEIANLRKAADAGDKEAQFTLGQRYNYGKGLPRDPVKAFDYYVKAADQGQLLAAFMVSVMLERGADVPADPDRALVYLRKAAEGGYSGAQQNLALWYENTSRDRDRLSQAFAWMFKAANANDAGSDPQLILAEYYRDGTGTRRNPAEAIAWMTKAANQGYRPAQLELGEALRDGKGTARAPVAALTWFLLAAGMTKVDAAAGCTRLIMESSVTRQRAQEAVKALQGNLSAAESDRAQADANNWVAAFKAKPVEGC
jgi:hypothetical protein